MQYREFARTGWKVSEIGFGAWQLGGEWGETDDDDSIRTLLHAFERGINFVDTAELYGKGRSEEVIGRALKEWRGDRIYVATKAQPTVWPSPSDDSPTIRGRYPSWHLRDSVEKSLKRLQVEQLDLFQLHCWVADGCTVLDWLETLNALKLEGKIDQIGVSIRDYRPSEGLDLSQLGLVNSVQVVLNLFEQRPAADLFQRGKETATAFIARVPLDSGSLTGTWHPQTYKSWRKDSVPAWLFREERFSETLRRVDALKSLCRPYYASLAEAAMRYVLSVPGLTTVIPGISNPRECDLNVAVSDGAAFPQELAEKLAAHAWPRNFYQ
ncbi:MAG: aldo/keto reductase [Candidatus Sulfotelmatobacter sp.]